MKKFKFSVIIAAYNSDLWISKAINSIINQTLDFEDNIQIILINDGIIDNTAKICQEYKARYPKNIIFINNEENRGSSAARNLGLKQASGKYINFLDSDDYITKHSFSGVYNFFKQNDHIIDMVSIPIYFFNRIFFN